MILPVIRLMRLYYAMPLAAGFVVIVAYLVGGRLDLVFPRILWSFLSLFGIISAGYVLNDVMDIEADKINCPQRTLVSGKLPTKTATIWSWLLFALGLACASFCGLSFLGGVIAVAVGLVVYDLYSKRMGFFKDVLVAVLATSLYPLAFTLTEPVSTPRLNVLYIHPVWFFLTALGYEMLKDIGDLEGDCQISGRAVNYLHDRWLLWLSRLALLIGGAVTLLPFILGYCRYVYGGISIIAVVLALAAGVSKPITAIRCIYAQVCLITFGSLADLLIFGP